MSRSFLPRASRVHCLFFFSRSPKGFFFFFVAVLSGDFIPWSSRALSESGLVRVKALPSLVPDVSCLTLGGSMWCCCVLFGPGPKPRQARDGHSWRMVIHCEWRPRFSFCQRAPRLSSPSSLGGVWKSGVRLSGLIADPRALLAVVRGGPCGRVRRFCPRAVHCALLDPLPRVGAGWLTRCGACPSRLVCSRALLWRASWCS